MQLRTIIEEEPDLIEVRTDRMPCTYRLDGSEEEPIPEHVLNSLAVERFVVEVYGIAEAKRTDPYESMLFMNGKSPRYFGDLPHTWWGTCQGYQTAEEAREGHKAFVARVRALMNGEGEK